MIRTERDANKAMEKRAMMNVPPYRRIQAGRTWSEPFSPYAVQIHRRVDHSVTDALFAFAFGLTFALLLFFWLSK